MRYILDTNVISELVARTPDSHVITWLKNTDENLLYLSLITIGEINKGIEKLPDSPRREQLVDWLLKDLMDRFRNRLVALDIQVMLTWGALTAHLEAIGKPLPAIDSLIAASALESDFVLVTRNTADFEPAGLQTLNPWLAEQ